MQYTPEELQAIALKAVQDAVNKPAQEPANESKSMVSKVAIGIATIATLGGGAYVAWRKFGQAA